MRGATAEAMHTVRAKAGEAYGGARDGARLAKDRAEATIDDAPLAALAGAAALGLLAGALLPATRAETETLGPLARSVGGGARTVLGVARDAGQDTLITLGINEAVARLRVDELLDAAAKALSAALDAAAGALPGGEGRHGTEDPGGGAADDDAPR